MSRKRIATLIVAAALAAPVLYLLAWPVPIDPQSWTPTPDPGFAGPYAENDALKNVERLFADDLHGPDFILIDRRGRLVTMPRDGRVIHLEPDTGRVNVLAVIGGRPLGFVHTPVETFLAADPLHGLVGAKGRRRFNLVTEVDGAPIGYASDVALTGANTLFFLDASKKFGHGKTYADLLEHGANGRLLRYDDMLNQTRVVLEELHFPYGLAVGPDDQYLLIAETSAYRVLRYWLTGEKAGQTDVFIDGLPGFPAHITWNGSGIFWLALQAPRIAAYDRWADQPWLRKVLYRLPGFLRPGPEHRAWVLGLNTDGAVVYNLQYAGKDAYAPVTSAREHGGWLYLGSTGQNGVARVRAPAR